MTLQTFPIRGPYKGVISDTPPPGDPAAFDDVVNFFMRKGRIQTRPRLNAFGAPPDGAILRQMVTFEDITNLFHTLVLTTRDAYMITAGPVYNLLGYPAGVTSLAGTSNPFAYESILNQLYFCNGSVPLLYSDGTANLKVAGDVPGSAQYLASVTETLVMGLTTEPAPGIVNSTVYPNRVRWCASGNPLEWDPTVDVTAGFNDLIEIPDSITGMSTLGRNVYIFHEGGIVVMFPTGIGVPPFEFEDFTLSPKGTGNIFPFAIDTFGGVCVFIAANEIYKFDGSTLTPIGLGNKKNIYRDLKQTSGDAVQGIIIPGFGAGYDFLSYWLVIPGVATWVYSFDDGNWVRFNSSAGNITGLNLVSIA